MCFTAPLCHCRIFSEQLFQLRFTVIFHLNFRANLFSYAKLKQLFRKYPMMTQRHSKTNLHVAMPIRSDKSRRQRMTHRRSEATGTSLCITIRFVLLLTTFFHYNIICLTSNQLFAIRFTICPDSECFYALRYDLFSC